MSTVDPVAAFHQRISTVARLVEVAVPDAEGQPRKDSAALGNLVHDVVAAVQDSRDSSMLWLLCVAMAGAFPTADHVLSLKRRLRMCPTDHAITFLANELLGLRDSVGAASAIMRLVTDRPVVDVDFTARHDMQTGVQRVVRQIMSNWHGSEPVEMVVWTKGHGAMRRLTSTEERRVLDFRVGLKEEEEPPPIELVVPWNTTLVIPEVPTVEQANGLAAMVRYSGNRVVAVGHDCIPIVSADILPSLETERFVRYLSVIKHATRIVAVSPSAANEFQGFCHMIAGQGLTGPDVVVCEEPVEVAGGSDHEVTPISGDPVVLCVGSHDPRKNHAAVLYAAEVLWREGHRFRLRLIGHKGHDTQAFDAGLARLEAKGRPVSVERSVGDAELAAAYRQARFTVFPSLQEGFGLPVAESLACHTPVITSDFGSTKGIIEGGGGIGIDPRDDEAVIDAMRRLLTDDALLARLVEECRARPSRTWLDYTDELRALVKEASR